MSGEKVVNPSVLKMVEQSLRAGGYDGLYQPDCCACLLDDLAPCGDMSPNCEAGYKTDGCGDGCDIGPCDFHVGSNKPAGAMLKERGK